MAASLSVPSDVAVEKAPVGLRSRRGQEWFLRFAGPALLTLFVAIIGTVKPSFFTVSSMTVLFEETAVILLLALGQTVVILIGGIDLANAALASLLAVVLALSLPGLGILGVVLTLLFGCAAGALQGAVHAYGQIPSFIVTLGGLGLWGGVALTLAAASAIQVREGYSAIAWVMADLGPMPVVVMLAAVLALLLGTTLWLRPTGRRIYALGSAEPVAILSGIRTARIRVTVFAVSGLFSALTAIVLVARLKSASAGVADGLMLPAIAAVVIGGTAVTGGVGGVWRTVIGALTIGVLRVGLTVMGIPAAQQQIFYGLLVIVAVAASLDRSRGVAVT